MVAIRRPGFYRGPEVALHQGELCFQSMGSEPKCVPLSGKPDTASHGDNSGKRGCKSRRIARKRWQFIASLTAPLDVGGGGCVGKLWKFAMGSPGKGE